MSGLWASPLNSETGKVFEYVTCGILFLSSKGNDNMDFSGGWQS